MDQGIKETLQGLLWGVVILLCVIAIWGVVAVVDRGLNDGTPFDFSPLLSLIMGGE